MIEALRGQGFLTGLAILPDSEEQLAKQVSVLEDFEQNNKKYQEYVKMEVESNRYVKECFRDLEEQFLRNTKQIASLTQEIESVETDLKDFLLANGIKAKELTSFTQFDAGAAQAMIDRKLVKQNQKLK